MKASLSGLGALAANEPRQSGPGWMGCNDGTAILGRCRPCIGPCKLLQRLAVDQIQHFATIEDFPLQQSLGDSHHGILALLDHFFGFVVPVFDQFPNLLVNPDSGGFAVVAVLCDLTAQKYLLVLLAEAER